jgi:hypothetical protein
MLKALEKLEDEWGNYVELKCVMKELVVIVNEIFDHKSYSRAGRISRYGNYFTWSYSYRKF